MARAGRRKRAGRRRRVRAPCAGMPYAQEAATAVLLFGWCGILADCSDSRKSIVIVVVVQ